jgi:ParB family chromosome partitioning protein
MVKRKSLGRGLDALLSSSRRPGPAAAAGESNLKELPVDLLSRGRFQPRIDMREETLTELADSIRAQGVVQPIVVRPIGDTADGQTRYEIVAGERRWRAAQLAGLDRVPAVIRDIPDEAAVAVALIENIQRENLNPIEEARSLSTLIEDFGMTHAEAADAVGRSRAAVSNLLRLLDLPAAVRELLESRALSMGHARALLAIEARELLLELAQRVVREGWSVRETERAVRKIVDSGGAAPGGRGSKARPTDPNVASLETRLSETLGAPVSIQHGPKGGRVVIRYTSLDELEGILGHVK